MPAVFKNKKNMYHPENLPGSSSHLLQPPPPPFPATLNRKPIPFVLPVLICNKYTYSVTLHKDALLTELGYFFTCSVFQSLANNEINSERQTNLDLITHVIYTQNDAVYEGQWSLRCF